MKHTPSLFLDHLCPPHSPKFSSFSPLHPVFIPEKGNTQSPRAPLGNRWGRTEIPSQDPGSRTNTRTHRKGKPHPDGKERKGPPGPSCWISSKVMVTSNLSCPSYRRTGHIKHLTAWPKWKKWSCFPCSNLWGTTSFPKVTTRHQHWSTMCSSSCLCHQPRNQGVTSSPRCFQELLQ